MSNTPKHYKKNGYECVDIMIDTKFFHDFCVGNIFKYIFRYKEKNGMNDLDKALTYAKWLSEDSRDELEVQSSISISEIIRMNALDLETKILLIENTILTLLTIPNPPVGIIEDLIKELIGSVPFKGPMYGYVEKPDEE